ncbi:hypothetical protein CerSpe_267550 [Prunus speciosa]
MFRNLSGKKKRKEEDDISIYELHTQRKCTYLLHRANSKFISDCRFLVYGDMPLRDFVSFIRMRIRVSRKKRIFVYCRNTELPFDALMSTIDEENKDEDGFLHITFSGGESVDPMKSVKSGQ